MKNRIFFAFVIAGCVALAMAFFGSSTQTTVTDYPDYSAHYIVPDGVAVASAPFEESSPISYFDLNSCGIVYNDYFEAPKGYYTINKGLKSYRWDEDKRERLRASARSAC